jgi:hypothetical protein
MRALHKLSHFVNRYKKEICVSVNAGSSHRVEVIQRALFLANTSCRNEEGTTLDIIFTSLKQAERIVPIINDFFRVESEGFDFFIVDKECEKYFND